MRFKFSLADCFDTYAVIGHSGVLDTQAQIGKRNILRSFHSNSAAIRLLNFRILLTLFIFLLIEIGGTVAKLRF